MPFEGFRIADDHHQDYYRQNPDSAHCRKVIAPKLEVLRKKFPSLRKD